MFNIGDFVVYGQSGVCQVTSVDVPQVAIRDGEKKLYYKLSPMFSTEVIYTPVDTKVYMRSVMTREQAKELLTQIADETKIPDSTKPNSKEEYTALLKTQDCEELLRVIQAIYYKKHDFAQHGKRLTMTDQKVLKHAEDLLCSELSVVMGNDLETTKSMMGDAITGWLSKICS